MVTLSTKKTISLVSALMLLSFSGWRLWQAEKQQSVLDTLQATPATQQVADVGEVLGVAAADTLEQVVVQRVVDGDTIELSDGRRVRYIGIDTPETKHPNKGKQCFGVEASERNQALVTGKTVFLEKDVSETDRYGRLLRYIWLDGRLINELLVAEGYAVSSSYPPDISRQQQFVIAERTARENKRGLWDYCQNTSSVSKQNEESESENECLIKGNISSNGKLYHLPGCSSYQATVVDQKKGELWFCSEADAEAAGWKKATGC